MLQKKIPVVVGVTGHRNITDEDKPALKEQVIAALKEVQALCKSKVKGGEDTPVVMLNAFAEGADILCAEAAFELGIDVYAVFPCEVETYRKSFENPEELKKFDGYCKKVKNTGDFIIAPDIEKNEAWLRQEDNVDELSYQYRQLGIYMAEHSHILIALWDGKEPKTAYGCGAVEVVKFALEHSFLDKDHLFTPATLNQTAAIWIKARRKTQPPCEITKYWIYDDFIGRADKLIKEEQKKDISYADGQVNETRHKAEKKRILNYVCEDTPPEFLVDIINKTVEYNDEKFELGGGKPRLWKAVDELDDYRSNIRYHYNKADSISYNKNQSKYTLFLMLLAVFASLVAFTFLIYDDASLHFMIFPCAIFLAVIIGLTVYGGRKGYHKNYIKYRAVAEALRIQFYMSMCLGEMPIISNVCELCSWTQKVDIGWIEKAIQALAVTSSQNLSKYDQPEVIKTWIGSTKDKQAIQGQLGYHKDRLVDNSAKAILHERISKGLLVGAIGLYALICGLEIASYICISLGYASFLDNTIFSNLPWRNALAIVLGTFTVISLLVSAYLGKCSYERKKRDNERMILLYSNSYVRWVELNRNKYIASNSEETEKFVKEIAREEIVENGIWCSYVNENKLEIEV